MVRRTRFCTICYADRYIFIAEVLSSDRRIYWLGNLPGSIGRPVANNFNGMTSCSMMLMSEVLMIPLLMFYVYQHSSCIVLHHLLIVILFTYLTYLPAYLPIGGITSHHITSPNESDIILSYPVPILFFIK